MIDEVGERRALPRTSSQPSCRSLGQDRLASWMLSSPPGSGPADEGPFPWGPSVFVGSAVRTSGDRPDRRRPPSRTDPTRRAARIKRIRSYPRRGVVQGHFLRRSRDPRKPHIPRARARRPIGRLRPVIRGLDVEPEADDAGRRRGPRRGSCRAGIGRRPGRDSPRRTNTDWSHQMSPSRQSLHSRVMAAWPTTRPASMSSATQ